MCLRIWIVPSLLVFQTVGAWCQQAVPTQILPAPGPPGQSFAGGRVVNPRPGGSQDPSTCSVDGTVVNAITGEPVPRARVSLNGAMAISDARGRFEAHSIRCGPLQPVASRPGFISRIVLAPGAAGNPQLIMLGPAEAAHDIRVPLTPQAVVTGVVTDDQGDPVMGAQVSAMASRIIGGRRTFQSASMTNTNDLGEFRLSSLPPGKYVICARANVESSPVDPRGAPASGEKCYPGPLDGGSAGSLELAAGREMRVPLSLPAVAAVHVRGTVSGLVKSRMASLSLLRRGTTIPGANRGTAVRPDGTFDIPGVTPGAYTLAIEYFEENARYSARVPVDVGTSDVDGLTVALNPGFTITGAVRVEGSDPTLPGRQQFSMSLRAAEPMAGGGRLTWSADNSTFTLNDLTPGTYRLEAFANNRFYIRRAIFNGRDISREDVAITQPGGVVDVVLGTDAGSIEGQVSDRDGKPVTASVMVVEEGRTPRNSNASEAGAFRVPSIAPGTYMVYAWDDFSRVEYANPEWMRRYAVGEKVTVEAGQTVQVKLVRNQAVDQ